MEAQIKAKRVPTLLGAMKDGSEFGSIVGVFPPDGHDILDEIQQALKDIQTIRGRPCLLYVGNVVRSDSGNSGIDSSDDLPFAEMVAQVPGNHRAVDIFLATRGGSGHQVTRFVNALRPRFDNVDFLLSSFCMSAGTLFALSGDHIWMTPTACLGPIDPQVPSKDGRYVPAQALQTLVNELQRQGDAGLKAGTGVPWTAVRLIDSMDKRDLGHSITASDYSTSMATQFLLAFKFQHWTTHHQSGTPVPQKEKEDTARTIAAALASHDRWKNHGHAISRDVLWSEIRLKIDHPDASLERAMARLWALLAWMFDKTRALKLIVSENYRFIRNEPISSARP